MVGQRVYVHAGKTGDFSDDALEYIANRGVKLRAEDFPPSSFGAIVGEVDITACLRENPISMGILAIPTLGGKPARWFVGPYGFLLKNPRLYEKPVPYKGQLGFFEVQLP